MSIDANQHTTRTFHITVLGRTLEHLGVQMYKRRDIAIAELVANSWDAGATRVDINIPKESEYDYRKSKIVITDDGFGMDGDQVQEEYLVVGRNRRLEEKNQVVKRPVMGRKGIGKLAGFGIASEMSIMTWRDSQSTTFTMNVQSLTMDAGVASEVAILGIIGSVPDDVSSASGTRITLTDLKRPTPLDIDGLREALGRRFSRIVFGQMSIFINGEPVGEPHLDLEERTPSEGYATEKLPSGAEVKYYYAFAEKNIRTSEMKGFTIYVRGKTAQAPPFFFNVEGTASGLQWTRYMTGAIEADFLDDTTDNESDIISTDRQEIDWADERTVELRQWGEALTRRALREYAAYKGQRTEESVMQDEGLRQRVARMDSTSQKQVSRFLRQLGQAEPDPERALNLSDALVRAYEYRHFHDVVQQIEDVSEDPEQLSVLLSHLYEWKVLESRAILEIVKGRIEVIEKFHTMIVNNAPETAPRVGSDNMHDLIANYPWLLNPDWQVLAEEKTISRHLREWNVADVPDVNERQRYDFLALADDHQLIVIEIKRSDHAVTFDELMRLEKYKNMLSAANKKIHMILVCGGTVNVNEDLRDNWRKRPDGDILAWNDIYERSRKYYHHYRAVLEGEVDSEDFSKKTREVARTREVLLPGSTYRDRQERKRGLGPQDNDFAKQGPKQESDQMRLDLDC